jgi:hypothetical protein
LLSTVHRGSGRAAVGFRAMFACPETGEPLRLAMPVAAAEIAIHCPKCGKLHSFAAAVEAADPPVSAPASA